MESSESIPNKCIMAVVGPKGGVGKSTIAANLGIAMANTGKTVTLVDLDLGAANLHVMLGITESGYTLDDFVLNKIGKLEDVVMATGIKGLDVICGGDIPGIANLAYAQKLKLIRHLSGLDSDMVIMDLSAGASSNMADFTNIAAQCLVVTTSEIPSLLNTYSFIKSTLFRRLTFHFKRNNYINLLELLEKIKDQHNNPHLKTMEDFLTEAARINPEGAETIRPILAAFSPVIVVNRIQQASEKSAGEVIKNLMLNYLSIRSRDTMTIREDPAVKKAMARMRPVMIEDQKTTFSVDIIRIAREFCP